MAQLKDMARLYRVSANASVVTMQPQPERVSEPSADPMTLAEAVYAGAITATDVRPIRARFATVSPRPATDPQRQPQPLMLAAAAVLPVRIVSETAPSLDRSGALAALRAREMAEQFTRQRAARGFNPPGEPRFRY